MAADWADLELRLEALERCVGVGEGAGEPRKVADEMLKLHMLLSNIAGKRERIRILFKKIEDVIKYLDPRYIDRIAVPDTVKLQFILEEGQSITSQAALLEQVKNLQPVLDSTSILVLPEYTAKLKRLSQIHIEQQEAHHCLNDASRTLIEAYNNLTLFMSSQFLKWDDILTCLEEAEKSKPAAE